MRTIGRIELKQSSDGTIENVEYVNGAIVELTRHEVFMLKLLQEACEGNNWTIDKAMDSRYLDNIKDTNMEDLFGLVWTYAHSRFAINIFKNAVNQLEETINRLDKIEEK